jgi:putative spermidine/putrescine transport system substrate-binding protein
VSQNNIARGFSRRRLLGYSGALVATGIVSAACGSGSSNEKPRAHLSKPASKPAKIVVRTWGDPWQSAIRDTVAKKFTAETGIGVDFDLSDFGPMHVKIQGALSSGSRPPVDVVHTVGFFAQKAAAQRLTSSLDDAIVTNMQSLVSVGRPKAGADGTPFVNLYSYTFPVIYDSARLTVSKEMSWSDLLDPKYASSFFAASTFEVLTFPFAKILGIDPSTGDMAKVWSELRKMRPTLSGFGQDSDFVNSMRARQSKWGSFIAGNALEMRKGGVKAEWVVPKEGTPLTVDSVYVPRGLPAETEYWAQVFVNDWLEAKTQTAFCGSVGVVPVNKDASPADFMKGDPAFPFSDDEIAKYTIPVPLEPTARHQDEWQAAYTAAMQG